MFERGRALLAARFFLRVAAVAAVPQLTGCSVTQFFGPLGHADSQQKRHINAEGEVWFPLGRQRDAQTLLESLGLRGDIGVWQATQIPVSLDQEGKHAKDDEPHGAQSAPMGGSSSMEALHDELAKSWIFPTPEYAFQQMARFRTFSNSYRPLAPCHAAPALNGVGETR
jgi:hypothetical protein